MWAALLKFEQNETRDVAEAESWEIYVRIVYRLRNCLFLDTNNMSRFHGYSEQGVYRACFVHRRYNFWLLVGLIFL